MLWTLKSDALDSGIRRARLQMQRFGTLSAESPHLTTFASNFFVLLGINEILLSTVTYIQNNRMKGYKAGHSTNKGKTYTIALTPTTLTLILNPNLTLTKYR